MSSTKPVSVYPQSNKDGVPIPHEIALPVGLLTLAVPAAGGAQTAELPQRFFMISVTADVDCILDFRATPSAIVAGQYAEGVFYVRRNTTSVIAINAMPNAQGATLTVHSLGVAGTVYLQTHSAWGFLGETTQTRLL